MTNFTFCITTISGDMHIIVVNNICTIMELLFFIQNKLELEDIPFIAIYNSIILNSNNIKKISDVFSSESLIKINIVKFMKMPQTFTSKEEIIYYINNIRTSMYQYFDKLIELLKKLDDYNIEQNYDISNKEFLLYYSKIYNSIPLRYISNSLKNDKQFILEIIKYNGLILESVSEEFKKDKNIVLAAVKNDGYALYYVSECLQNDKDIIIESVKSKGYILYYICTSYRNNKKIVSLAVKNCGFALQFASEILQNNKKIVLLAINNYGFSLKYASEYLKNDKDERAG